MSEEDVKLLEAVRDWRPPEKLHPMAMVVWGIYEDAGNKMSPTELGRVRELFDAYGEDLTGLAEAMEGVVRFMLYVGDELKDKESAKAIGDLMREYMHLYEPFWQQVAEALQNVGSEARESFSEFLDPEDKGKKVAPTYGEAPPQGTIPLRNLAPPVRPPTARPPAYTPKKK